MLRVLEQTINKFVLLIVGGLLTFSSANDLIIQLKDCSSKKDNNNRLHCYDNLVQNINKSVDKQENTDWKITSFINPMTDKKAVSLEKNSFMGPNNRGVVPLLKIYCEEEIPPQVSIDWAINLSPINLSKKVNVTSRLGSNNIIKSVWKLAQNYRETFYISNAEYASSELIIKLAENLKFSANIKPFREKLMMVSFQTHNLNQAIKPFNELCGIISLNNKKIKEYFSFERRNTYDNNGYDKNGFNRDGIHRNTNKYTNLDGINKYGKYIKE